MLTSNKNIITDTAFEALDTTSKEIINIIEEYIKPAVASDGGNILFESYDENSNMVKVILQGACSGCPSSTFTLKRNRNHAERNATQSTTSSRSHKRLINYK